MHMMSLDAGAKGEMLCGLSQAANVGWAALLVFD